MKQPFWMKLGQSQDAPSGTRMICVNCGNICQPESRLGGSNPVELFVFLNSIFAGVLYRMWRHKAEFTACTLCHSTDLIPLDSPRGKKLAQEYSRK